MAYIVNEARIGVQPIADKSTTQKHPLGTIVQAHDATPPKTTSNDLRILKPLQMIWMGLRKRSLFRRDVRCGCW